MNHKSSSDCLTDEDVEQVAGGMTCSEGLAAFNTCMNVSDYFGSLGLSGLAKSFDMGVAYGKAGCG